MSILSATKWKKTCQNPSIILKIDRLIKKVLFLIFFILYYSFLFNTMNLRRFNDLRIADSHRGYYASVAYRIWYIIFQVIIEIISSDYEEKALIKRLCIRYWLPSSLRNDVILDNMLQTRSVYLIRESKEELDSNIWTNYQNSSFQNYQLLFYRNSILMASQIDNSSKFS